MSGSHLPRVTRAFLVLATALAFAACKDATAPDNTTVAVTVVRMGQPQVYGTAPGELVIQCDVDLRATATGRATWLDATLLFYVGTDRTTPIDSARIAASEIQDAWGAPDIESGVPQDASWRFTAGIPFGASIIHHYRTSGGQVRSAAAQFTCGPDIPPGTMPATINSVTVQPPGAEIEPGATLTVEYTAASDVGLWTTRVRLSGACTDERWISEQLAHNVTRTVTFPIVRACTLGAQVAVQVLSMDAAGLTATVNAPQRLTVVDRTPPRAFAGQ